MKRCLIPAAQAKILYLYILLFEGVAVGIAISNTYDPDSITANAVQGVFDCVSGGLLLYISLVQLIAEDFTRIDADQPRGLLFRLATYGALALGAGCMAMLAIWA